MWNKGFMYFFVLVLMISPWLGLSQSNTKGHRILIVLNGSSSMSSTWLGNQSRFDAAASAITQLIEEVYKLNEEAEFGLWVYGHQFTFGMSRCNDARREVMFSKDNLAQITLRLKDIKPKGRGSVEYAIKEADKADMTDTQAYRYSLIVLTDSNSVCPDNICIPVNQFGKSGKMYKRYVLDMTGKIKTGEDYECFDKIWPLVNDYSIDTAIINIAKNYQVKRTAKQVKVVYETKPKSPGFEKEIIKSKETPVIKQVKVADPIGLDTVKKPKTEEFVKIRKESRIKSEVDEFGYLQLMNTSNIGRIIIYIQQKGTYVQSNEIYPVGMDELKVKLKTGSYKMVFNAGGMTEGARTFEIKTESITDMMFR